MMRCAGMECGNMERPVEMAAAFQMAKVVDSGRLEMRMEMKNAVAADGCLAW